MYQRIIGFTPDFERPTPGALTDCENLVPDEKGMKTRATPVDSVLPSLTATCVGSVTLKKSDGTTRTFAGTIGELFEESSNAWTDRTRASGDYTGGVSTRWRFAQYRDTSLAAMEGIVLQQSSSGAFADITSAPTMLAVEVVNDFAIGIGIAGDPDRWQCSAIGNPGNWTTAISTQCTSGRMTDTPGPLRAIRRLGSDAVGFKSNSVYLGRYLGPPLAWGWSLISDEVGAPCQEAVVPIDNSLVFIGFNDIYLYDGSRPISIGGPIREWFFQTQLDHNNRAKIWGHHEATHNRIYWWYPSRDSGGILDRFICWNYQTNMWGAGSLMIEAALTYIPAGLNYEELGTQFLTYEDLPQVEYDSPFWTPTNEQMGIFNTSHKLQTLDGAGATASFTTWDYGEDGQYIFVSRLRPRYVTKPVHASLVNSWKEDQGDDPSSSSATASLINGKFDFERSARWHSFRHDSSGDMVITGIDIETQNDGWE